MPLTDAEARVLFRALLPPAVHAGASAPLVALDDIAHQLLGA